MTRLKDMHVGDIITNGTRRYKVTSMDFLAGTVAGAYVGGDGTPYNHAWTGKGSWEQMGYDKEVATTTTATAQQQQGIMAWLTKQPQPSQQSTQGILTPQTHVIELHRTAASKKTRKQVSHNGKDWCDYRLLLDADDFESYEHRREI